MLPDVTRISHLYNAPPAASLMKDLFVMWIFAWAIAANSFNAVAALEELMARRQFVTARACQRWDSPLEARMPIRCVHFPWVGGAIAIGLVMAYLIVLDLNYYALLDPESAGAYWETFLGLGRDLLFVVAIGEVLVFYKVAVAAVRKVLA